MAWIEDFKRPVLYNLYLVRRKRNCIFLSSETGKCIPTNPLLTGQVRILHIVDLRIQPGFRVSLTGIVDQILELNEPENTENLV
jgi:hypothetical protein